MARVRRAIAPKARFRARLENTLERALERAAGNKNVAARLLGISRRSLYYKLDEHGLLGAEASKS